MTTLLVLGSGPNAIQSRNWPRAPFDRIVAINNAWRVRPDWDFLIHPSDFAINRMPSKVAPEQRIVTAADYVPVQNTFGGFVYAGGTMAFTAGYWALGALAPTAMAFLGCDMIYPSTGHTHFYGTGTADPLRNDITLRSLTAKSARLMIKAAQRGCACVNLSTENTQLIFPRSNFSALPGNPTTFDPAKVAKAEAEEARLGYMVLSGKYWKEEERFDAGAIDALDALWLEAAV